MPLCGCHGTCSGFGWARSGKLGWAQLSVPASSLQDRGHPRDNGKGRNEKRDHTMEWCKAAHPTLSKWGDIVLSPWDVPNVVLPGAPCCGWPLTCGIACEGEELRLLISTARNLFVLWFFVPGLKLLLLVVAYQPAGPVRASACLAPQGLPHGSARQGAFLCVCLSVHPCSAVGLFSGVI